MKERKESESLRDKVMPRDTALDPLLQPASLATNEDKCTKEQGGEVRSEGKDLNLHVRDLRIKDVRKAKNVNQSAEKAHVDARH